MMELPAFGLKAYALFYSRHSDSSAFKQNELDWIVSEPMKKKIFSILLKAGWIVKVSRSEYKCIPPEKAITGLLDFRVPELLKTSGLPYALTGLSAVELWSDYSYVQRGLQKSPYFINVLKKDFGKWRVFLNANSIPNYVNAGAAIGEFVVLHPVNGLEFVEKNGLKVIPLKEALRIAKNNSLYSYAYSFIKKKYGA